MQRSKKFIVNISSNIGINVIFNLISLFTLPLFVTYYSSPLYGVFIIATTLTDSLAMFDFGIGGALVRYTAEYTKDRDREKYSSAIAESLLIAVVLGLLFSAIMFAMSFFAVGIFNIEAAHSSVAKDLFQLGAIYTFIIVLFNITDRLLEGNQLFYWRNIGKIPLIIVVVILYFIVRYHGLSFFNFAVVMMTGRLLPGIVNLIVIFSKGLLKDISLKNGINIETLQSEFLRYSGNFFLLQIIAFCTFQADKFVIASIMSTSFVTVYALITKPMYIIRMVNNQSLAVLGPIFARQGLVKHKKTVKDIICRGNLVHSLLIYPLTALLIMFIHPFFICWMPEFLEYAHWGAIAGTIFIFAPCYSILTRLLIYTGEVTIVRNINFWTALVNVVISVFGTLLFGIGGVIIGSLVHVVIQVPVYIVVARRMYGLSAKDMFPKEMLFNFLFVVFCSIVLFLVMPYFVIDSWLRFFGCLLVAAILFYTYGLYVLMSKKLFSSPLITEAGV